MRAQVLDAARITGTVMDSLHHRSLAGATVLLTRVAPTPSEFYSAESDTGGHFAFDGLRAGRYTIALTHAILDTLQQLLPPQELTLAVAERRNIALGLPSRATLRVGACPDVSLGSGQGALIGRVVDAESEMGISSGDVIVRWPEITVVPGTLRGRSVVHSRVVHANAVGEYRACGLPTDSWIDVQVAHDAHAGAMVRTTIPDDVGIRRLDMSLSLSDARTRGDATVIADRDTSRVFTGTASVRGVVRGSEGQPLNGAELRVVDAAPMARSDSSGRFTLRDLPSGTQLLEARHLGYRVTQRPVELRSGRTTELEIRLERAVLLDSVLITAQRIRYREFEEDRKHLYGRFMDATALARDASMVAHASDLVLLNSGYRIDGQGYGARVFNTRRGGCYTNVVIDGMQNQSINSVRPTDIGAMEVFTGREDGPQKYNHGCGSIVIHTRR